jgi:hypothetical protein
MAYVRKSKDPNKPKKNLPTGGANDPPIMFAIICSAITTSLIEYLYAKADDEDEDKDGSIAHCAQRVKVMNRWLMRRYGPEITGFILTSVVKSPQSMGNKIIPGFGNAVYEMIQASLLEIYE